MSDDFTTTPNYGLFKPTVDADVDVWGDHLNANADTLDGIIKTLDERSAGGGGLVITDFLPPGQPDGVTDLASYFQAALDAAAGVVVTGGVPDRAGAPGFARLIVPANTNAYIIGASLYIPSHSHVIIEHGATLKLAAETNASMFFLAAGSTDILVELYGTLDGNASAQTGVGPGHNSGGICCQGNNGSCSNSTIHGDRNGLITNFYNWPVSLTSATNVEVRGISMTNSGSSPEFAGITSDIANVVSGTYTAATGIVSVITDVAHGIIPGAELTIKSTAGSGGFLAAEGAWIAGVGTTGTTLVYQDIPGGTDGTLSAGVVGVCVKSYSSGFADCFVDNINDLSPALYGGCVNCYIRNTEVMRCGSGPSIYADGGQPGRNIGCEISGCYTHDNPSNGLVATTNGVATRHTNSRIFDNFSTRNRGGAIIDRADGLDFYGNRLYANRIAPVLGNLGTGEIRIGNNTNRVDIHNNIIRDPVQGSTSDSIGYGIWLYNPNTCRIAGNSIGDYQAVPTMYAAIGGNWGGFGLSEGNYYGPRIATDGYFPADRSVYSNASVQGISHDLVTGYVCNSTPPNAGNLPTFPGRGLTPAFNKSGGRGEVNFIMGFGEGGPGGFDFVQLQTLAVMTGTYSSSTGAVSMTTNVPHTLTVGSVFTLGVVTGTAAGAGSDWVLLVGWHTATAGTAGSLLNFTTVTGLDITSITGGKIGVNGGDVAGVVNTSVGLSGSVLANDGLGNTRLGGALVHGAMQTASLANAGTVTVNPNTSLVLVQNASSIATGAVVLPAPQALSYQLGGAGLEIRFQNAIGALTMTAAAGASVAGPPTAVLSGGSSFRFVLTEPGNVWLPCLADISGTPPVGGPYLPLTGGAVTGATTFGALTTHAAGATVSGGTLTAGAASLTGTTSLGTASTNYVQITGAASNPLITVAGAGTNGALLLQSQGHGAINMRSATGGLITQFADGSTTSVGNYLTISAKNAGTAVTLAATDATAGLSLVGPTSINRAWAYSGNWSVANSVLTGQWTITGTATDSSATPLNYFLTTDNLRGTTNATLTHFALRAQIGAASAGPRNAAQTTITQTAQTANFANGLIPNYTAHQFNATASFNEGGTAGATNSRGAIWGQTIGTMLNSGATYFGGVIGTEYDMVINTGASASKVASISITGPGNARGTYLTTGIAFAGNVNTGAASLEHGINFSDQSWGDTAFSNTSTFLYAEYSTASGISLPIGWFADMLQPTFAGGFLRSKGFSVDGTGTMQIGTGLLKALSTGLAIDATGAVGTGTPTIAAGGTGFVGSDLVRDGYGGIYQVTVTGGVITGVIVVIQPACPSAPPANPVAVSAFGTSSGTGATLNLTWDTTRTGLSLNPTGQKIGFNSTAPIAKPTVSGSRGGNAALASLLTALAAYGLVTDSSS